jgi:DNA-binding CsgD family transcriptional regulator
MAISQSEKIRRMASKGATNGEIAKKLGIRYQTVWRTLHRDKGIEINFLREELLQAKKEEAK